MFRRESADARRRMERGLYIAATGMLTAMVQQDTIAANLANVNTVGYKGDRVVNETFGDLFLSNLANGRAAGEVNLGTRVAGVVTDFSQGALRNTGNGLDLALGGDGFFTIQKADGSTAYTRAGQFMRSSTGYLVNQNGDHVLNSAGQRMLIGGKEPRILEDGRVYSAEGAPLGEIGVATLDITTARKVGDSLWEGTVIGGKPPLTMVRQGFVEASGVNSVKEMINMINVLRSYESSQRVMTSIDGTLDKAVNSLGTLG